MVAGITVFYRLTLDDEHYNIELFWSYRKAQSNGEISLEIILNYLMFMPFEIMVSLYLKGRWALMTGLLFSIAIELLQFFMHRGLFEFDDIVGNTLGTLIGMVIHLFLKNDFEGSVHREHKGFQHSLVRK